MGSDEYHPIEKKGSNLTEAGGIGYFIVDSIDTMQIMGLREEYESARNWVANKQSFERDGNFNTFEVRLLFPFTLSGNSHAARQRFESLVVFSQHTTSRMTILSFLSGLKTSLIVCSRLSTLPLVFQSQWST